MTITIVIPENSVNVDGTTYLISLPNIPDHSKIYSIIWLDTYGEYDYNNGTMPTKFTEKEYDSYILPYLTAWEEARDTFYRIKTEQEASEYAQYNSPEALQRRFRRERDKRLSKTDFYFQPDYPAISEENMKRVKAYRIALRDMTTLEGFPWDGGGENTPWPTLTLK